jgi:hypothetical protein
MEKNNLIIVSLVAIVAIVGMLFMTMNSGERSFSPTQEVSYSVDETAQGDLAGQAIKAATRPIARETILEPIDPIPIVECYSDEDCKIGYECVKNMCVMPTVIQPSTPLIHIKFWRVQYPEEFSNPDHMYFFTQIYYSSELQQFLDGSSLTKNCVYGGDYPLSFSERNVVNYEVPSNVYSPYVTNIFEAQTSFLNFGCYYKSDNDLINENNFYTSKNLPVFDEVRFLKDMITGEYFLQVKAHSNELINYFSYGFFEETANGGTGFGIEYSPDTYSIDKEFKIDYDETLNASIYINLGTNIKQTEKMFIDIGLYTYFKIVSGSKSIERIDGKDYQVYDVQSLDISPEKMKELEAKVISERIMES